MKTSKQHGVNSEHLEFSENKYRTKRLNAVVELIANINRPFGRNKKGQFEKKSELSYQVAPPRIELGFKV